MNEFIHTLDTLNHKIKYQVFKMDSENVSAQSLGKSCVIFFFPSVIPLYHDEFHYHKLFNMLITELNATLIMPVHISKKKHNIYVSDSTESENNWWKGVKDTTSLYRFHHELVHLYKHYMNSNPQLKKTPIYLVGHSLGCNLASMLSWKVSCYRLVLFSPYFRYPMLKYGEKIPMHTNCVNVLSLFILAWINTWIVFIQKCVNLLRHYFPSLNAYKESMDVHQIDMQHPLLLASIPRFHEYTMEGRLSDMKVYDVYHLVMFVWHVYHILTLSTIQVRIISSKKSSGYDELLRLHYANPKNIKLYMISDALRYDTQSSLNIAKHIMTNNDIFNWQKFRYNALYSLYPNMKTLTYTKECIQKGCLKMNEFAYTYF